MSGNNTIDNLTINVNQAAIIKALLYFELFGYPLTRAELRLNCCIPMSDADFYEELNILLLGGILKEEDGFLLSPSGLTPMIEKRIKGNLEAEKIMPLAYRYSRKIAAFPFVEGVFLSGALSKNYYDEFGDFDFFIVTKPNRLWICRTLLILRYKLLPKEKKKFWCVNYFISADNLLIQDVNVFTATELVYLMPAVNYSLYEQMMHTNAWARDKFPNKNISSARSCADKPVTVARILTHFLMGGWIGNWIDNLLLSVTLKHWRKKFPEMSEMDFELQFRSRKNVCKRHNHGYQNKVLRKWEEKQKAFESMYNVTLN